MTELLTQNCNTVWMSKENVGKYKIYLFKVYYFRLQILAITKIVRYVDVYFVYNV